MLRKVMTVDDSEMIRTMYRLMLRQFEDCQVIPANNGREAIEKLDGGDHFDLILLDVNMPVMNGLEFLETFKRQNRPLPAPVIIVSTEGQNIDVNTAVALGASAYLVKPFKSARLLELIESVLAAGDQRPPLDAASAHPI